MGRKFAATPMKTVRRNYTYNVSQQNGTNSLSCDMNHGRRGEIKAPTSYMFRESQRMAAQQHSHRQAINNRDAQAINPNTNFRPYTTNYVDPLRTVDPVRIKDREIAHGLYTEENAKDVPEDKQNNWEDPVIYKKRYNGHLPYTGYVDPSDKHWYRKRNFQPNK